MLDPLGQKRLAREAAGFPVALGVWYLTDGHARSGKAGRRKKLNP
ncbi:hypothetical protein MPNT_10277 [Candidatus Methylacidithermus pantelleriae]|uniref:Uncharacterized protein n=1 Tax=Candidatus Methylacidithermus pantelleriae TaxID=2744239 RepID=A0A8J2BME8_9BACT|nr:hypothetical protein MPNT_10277 [Candidatus Methylacidithermus pantelleriae]